MLSLRRLSPLGRTSQIPLRFAGLGVLVFFCLVILVSACAVLRQPLAGAGNPGAPDRNFPWPPPQPSASVVLPASALGVSQPLTTLGEVAARLDAALNQANYGERRYFAVTGGFAIVTRIEQTDLGGTPKAPPERWVVDNYMELFSEAETLKAFFHAPPGYFQVLEFIVTDQAFQYSAQVATPADVNNLMVSGYNILPPSIAEGYASKRMKCTVLVYEFVKPVVEPKTTALEVPGRMTARDHLEKASLWAALGKTQ